MIFPLALLASAPAHLLRHGSAPADSPLLWAGFLAGVVVLLFIDLHLAAKRLDAQTLGAAIGVSVVWVLLSVAFGGLIWALYGTEAGLQFFAGYLLEKSLSVDNLFVFVLIFGALRVPPELQHRTLFFGVVGALLLRGVMIIAGVALVHRFHWLLPVFGLVLLATAWKLAFGKEKEEAAPIDSWVVRRTRAVFPVTNELVGDHFFVRREGRLFATPLFLALVAAEGADLVFAVDSISAIFGVADDSFLLFSSNVCAILGLRALYFVVAGALAQLRYLKPGLAVVMLFVGLKMILGRWVPISTGASLLVIAGILGITAVASLLSRRT